MSFGKVSRLEMRKHESKGVFGFGHNVSRQVTLIVTRVRGGGTEQPVF